MKTIIKTIKPIHLYLALLILFSFGLLAIRIQLTHSFYYAFLVWNLFLAGIPYFITQLMTYQYRSLKYTHIILGIIWLLFLPNSPYIITDFVHLHNSQYAYNTYFDLFLVFTFALSGLLFGILSLLDMYAILLKKWSATITKSILFMVCILCGFGIYLGRFLRFNSWDITTQPKYLAYTIFSSLQTPKVWAFTIAFGGFMWLIFGLLKSVNIGYREN